MSAQLRAAQISSAQGGSDQLISGQLSLIKQFQLI
jgi:hypothetical protein